MRFFKYCGSDIVDIVQAGSLRFASLAWFRKIEDLTGDAVIGDRMEGMAETRVDSLATDGRATPEQDRALRAVGVIDEGLNNTYSNIVHVNSCGHQLVLCLSMSEKLALAGTDYDACVEISDINALLRCINETGRLNGVIPLADLFEKMEAGEVHYLDRTLDAVTAQAQLAASPFVKRTQYAGQREFRIVLTPRDEWMPDIQYIHITPPAGLLAVVERPAKSRERGAPKTFDRFQFLREAAALVREMKAASAANRAEHDELQRDPSRASDREGWRDRWLALTDRQRVEFQASYYQRVKELYWSARAEGHRGEWEETLDDATGISGWMFAEELGRLAFDVFQHEFPATHRSYSDRPARPYRNRRRT